jgi:hypothetical protein
MLVSRNNKKIFYFNVLIYSIYSLYLGKLTIVGGGGRYQIQKLSKRIVAFYTCCTITVRQSGGIGWGMLIIFI